MVAVLLSSALSGTFQGACIAREMMDPEDATHIHLVDSLSATVGERFLLLHAAALRDRGASAAEIAAELTELRRRITIWASVDTLEYLCKGGRLSRTAAGVGSLAKVKPIITLTREGRVAVQKKCIGKSRCMSEITALTEKRRPDPSHPVFGLYSFDAHNCSALAGRLAACGFSIAPDHYLEIGPTIGAHIGPHAYGVAYIAADE